MIVVARGQSRVWHDDRVFITRAGGGPLVVAGAFGSLTRPKPHANGLESTGCVAGEQNSEHRTEIERGRNVTALIRRHFYRLQRSPETHHPASS